MNKKIALGLLGLLGLFFLVGVYNSSDDYVPTYPEPNYKGLIELGLIPNTEPRLATEKDIDTKLRGVYGDKMFGLFESRTWETGDYGKTFLAPVN